MPIWLWIWSAALLAVATAVVCWSYVDEWSEFDDAEDERPGA